VTSDEEQKGVYLYCIAEGSHEEELGRYGIEDSLVYSIPYKDLCAVVHDCSTEPYKTSDVEEGREWVLTHQYVLDLVSAQYGTIIPLTFDTIFKGGVENVKDWFRQRYDLLYETLQRLEGKNEYGVEVLIDDEFIRELVEEDRQIRNMREKIKSKPEGMAYMLKKKLDRDFRKLEEKEVQALSRDLLKKVTEIVEDVKVADKKTRASRSQRGKKSILNLSCLSTKENAEELGRELGGINKEDGMTVRFTGPWPPYSFVTFSTEQMEKGEDR